MERIKDAHQKALSINLNKEHYGTIAEIGAGQETARWFFRVGGAAGTIAKAISAYDMKFSDSIYGPSPRYVSRERLQAMLDHEYRLIIERLGEPRGATSIFFAFANTVAARSYSRKQDGHGWMGILFQTVPGSEPSRIDMHVQLHGRESVQDQESLGLLGLNLIHAALHYHDDPDLILEALMDGLYPELAEIDMIDFSGPAFREVDNRLMALQLVQRGLTSAALFTPDGHLVHPADALYKKAVLVERSRFRPPTHLTLNMLECAHRRFLAEREIEAGEVVVLSEMTLHNLRDGGDIDVQDFLHRAEILCALGKNVLISNLGEYYRLAAYLFRHTQRPIGVAMGMPNLQELFNEKYYDHLPGGILESFGRLFKFDLRLYVCPSRDPETGVLRGIDDIQLAPHLRHLYAYLHDQGHIRGLDNINPDYLSIYSHDVLDMIRGCRTGWEEMVPPKVAQMIKEQNLFGCGG